MKFLYVFKPCYEWSYCGGGCVALAGSMDEAQELVREREEDTCFFETEKSYEEKKNLPENAREDVSIYAWILVETFQVEEQSSRLVLYDYNWG